ncbi:MAG: ATP-binding protein [Oscillospiraceae bacterium]|nr:ATP-binding protein [Oscillospiraceae bacterium]
MKTIFFRYFFMTATLLLTSVIVISTVMMLLIHNYLQNEQQVRLDRRTLNLRDILQEHDIALDDPVFRASLHFLADATRTHIMFVDLSPERYGYIKFRTSNHIAYDNLSPDALTPIYEGIDKFDDTLDGFFATRYYTRVIPIVFCGSDQHVTAILVSLPIDGHYEILLDVLYILLFISLLVVFAAAVSAYFMSRRILAPLNDMRVAVQNFSLGNYAARVPYHGKRDTEMAELATAINAMAVALEVGEEARAGFIANVSHEIRTPITNILGYINGILDGTLPQDRSPHYLGIIRDEIMRLSRLVKRMLDIARVQSGAFVAQPHPMDLCELAAQMLLLFETQITDKQLDVQVDMPDAAFCLADEEAIAQICFNLIENAIKFSEPGSPLKLKISQQNDKAWFSITNFGDEIKPADMPLLFDRFYKVDISRSRDPSGLGLGLFLVKTIINAHGEQIYVESHDGETTFKFSLPDL